MTILKIRSITFQLALAVVPIILSLALTALLVMVVGADPRAVFEKVWEGAFRGARSVAQVLNFWIPLTLVSMGLIVTFTAGLWNIGVEGQIMMGAVFAT
jgi:simple sugar transport system permease protein